MIGALLTNIIILIIQSFFQILQHKKNQHLGFYFSTKFKLGKLFFINPNKQGW